jgi:hypothetical protein
MGDGKERIRNPRIGETARDLRVDLTVEIVGAGIDADYVFLYRATTVKRAGSPRPAEAWSSLGCFSCPYPSSRVTSVSRSFSRTNP